MTSIQRGVFGFQSPPFFIELGQINLRRGAGFENAVEAPLSRYGLLLLLFAQRPQVVQARSRMLGSDWNAIS